MTEGIYILTKERVIIRDYTMYFDLCLDHIVYFHVFILKSWKVEFLIIFLNFSLMKTSNIPRIDV